MKKTLAFIFGLTLSSGILWAGPFHSGPKGAPDVTPVVEEDGNYALMSTLAVSKSTWGVIALISSAAACNDRLPASEGYRKRTVYNYSSGKMMVVHDSYTYTVYRDTTGVIILSSGNYVTYNQGALWGVFASTNNTGGLSVIEEFFDPSRR